MNFVELSGLLAGSMTAPPALTFANELSGSDAPTVTYAMVYPLTMLLRVLVRAGAHVHPVRLSAGTRSAPTNECTPWPEQEDNAARDAPTRSSASSGVRTGMTVADLKQSFLDNLRVHARPRARGRDAATTRTRRWR